MEKEMLGGQFIYRYVKKKLLMKLWRHIGKHSDEKPIVPPSIE